MWEKLSTTERIFSIIVVMGSVVDIFQFTWLIKKSYLGIKKKIYQNVEKQLLLNMHQEKKKEKAPFMGFEEDK
jgi:hypothetical protein